jgi:hypothetical protein
MTIYTIEAHGRPVVAISIGNMPPLEDSFATRPELLRALRTARDMEERLPDDGREHMRRQAIDEALDTWLGGDLCILESEGRPLWSGDRDALRVREASPDEAAVFAASRERAVREGELDAGDEDWVAPVMEPDDDDDDDDDEEEDDEGGV